MTTATGCGVCGVPVATVCVMCYQTLQAMTTVDWERCAREWEQIAQDARAEVERLRAALTEMLEATSPYSTMADVFRARALAEVALSAAKPD